MANTKNAVIRYRALDRCFSNRRIKYDISKLIEAVSTALNDFGEDTKGISRATVYADIVFMKSARGYNIDLDENFKDGRTRYYRYTDADFSINKLPLTEVELNQLQTTVSTLSLFKGLPQFEWIEELIPKLRQGISTEQNNATIIDFDSNRYLKGIEHIGTLYNAVFYKRVLSITYQPYQQEKASEIMIHPHFLKQYNNRWFLFGYNPEAEKPNWNLALDRIVDIKETQKKYLASTINWNEYFDDIIGVTKEDGRNVETITLHFFEKAGKYVETKPIHGSQWSQWLDNGILEVRLKLIPNYEFFSLMLSYADKVRVMYPEHIANVIKKSLSDAVKRYCVVDAE
jgi:predicted DNA-binding transcriptional regulator YafY